MIIKPKYKIDDVLFYSEPNFTQIKKGVVYAIHMTIDIDNILSTRYELFEEKTGYKTISEKDCFKTKKPVKQRILKSIK